LADNISAALHLECQERIDAVSRHMAENKCKDFSEYKELVGRIYAYSQMMGFIEDQEQAVIEDEDRGE